MPAAVERSYENSLYTLVYRSDMCARIAVDDNLQRIEENIQHSADQIRESAVREMVEAVQRNRNVAERNRAMIGYPMHPPNEARYPNDIGRQPEYYATPTTARHTSQMCPARTDSIDAISMASYGRVPKEFVAKSVKRKKKITPKQLLQMIKEQPDEGSTSRRDSTVSTTGRFANLARRMGF